jgi:amino acid adenylation domain-containing protein
VSESLSTRIDAALQYRGRGTALVAGGESVSGEELRGRALGLAAALRARGVEAGDTVAILVDRSVASVVAILAVLDLGCAYLPLDPTTPDRWLNRLLALAGARLLVFPDECGAVATRLAPLPLGAVPASVRASTTPSRNGQGCDGRREPRLAYVMGTSGTTGEPKAVPVRASSLLHYCDAFAARVGGAEVLAGMRMASITTLAADLGNTMVFPSLLFGGELHLVPLEVSRDPRRFGEYIRDHRIDALKVVPTHLRVLLDRGADVLPRRLLVVGGEPFGLDLLTRLEACAPRCAVFNHYGPTEATVGVAMHPVGTTPGTAERLRGRGHRSVPVGTPLGDNRLRVVDEWLRPCEDGTVGELVVSGPSVSDGYLGSPDGSGARFVQADGDRRAYRTGDLARAYPTGEIEVLGRMDRQFKVRGYRIEATGVEQELRAHPGVFDAFVDRREQDGLGAGLVAWVHAEDGVDEPALRGFLGDRLPPPMVPSRIVVTDGLPRTSNGKVDPRALPDPHGAVPAEAPRSAEEAVARVFAGLLALPLEAAHDNFFRLGGHSLTALQAIGRLRDDHRLEVSVDDFYSDASPAGIARAARPAAPPAPTGAAGPPVQLSAQAHALWAHLRLNPRDTVYEVPVRLRVQGSTTPDRVRQALADFAARHEALRTRFEVRDGRPVPVVDADARSTLSFGDDGAQAGPPAGGLDVERGPLVRGRVSEAGPGACLVDLLVHHIAFDGASTAVLVRDLAAMLAGEPLPPARQARAGAGVLRQPEPAPLGDGARARFGLPPAPSLRDGPSRCHELRLPPGLWERVEARATALDTTPFVVAAAAWALVLSRQDGEPAVTIGTPADLRDPSMEAGAVGYHTNVVVLALELPAGESVRDLIGRTHAAVGRALRDRHRPYAARVAAQRAATGTAPTRTLLTVERLERARCAGVQVWQEAVVQPRPTFDVDVGIIVSDRGAALQIHHRLDVCPEGRARCLGDQLVHVLERFEADPDASSRDVSILPAAWADRVLEWSRAPTASLADEWGARAFARHALADPDATALVWPGGQWSRARFAEAVARTARTLRDRGLGPGHAVAVAVPPSPALAVAWHAAHEVGAAVLALDPVWPQHRLDAAARRARSDVRVTSPDGVAVEVTGSAGAEAPHASDLSYLILTSGSTGAPKLVAIQRRALANELAWYPGTFPMGRDDRVLAHSSPGFDVTVLELLGPLSWGACLVFPAPGRRNDVPHLAELIQEEGVSVIAAVPSLLEALLAEFRPGPLRLRLLLSGGEELPPSLPSAVARRLPDALLANTYGPTETAIDATYHCLGAPAPAGGRVPLGRPVPGTWTYVLDDQLRLLPPGASGQLAIAGKSVGRGYWGDPGETARRFVPNPYAGKAGARMYLTGDRVRWSDDALLEYVGRQDHQVKVRGNRIELEEVEAALRSLPMVRDAVVHVQDAGTARARLVALVVPAGPDATTVHDLHQHSARLLPPYMVPSAFGLVETLPRLSNGKVARDALPLDAVEQSGPTGEWRTEMEARVGQVWTDVLGHGALDRDLPFFASGGTSLLVPVLQLRLREAVGATLSVPELFEHASISAQASALEQRVAGVEAEAPVVAARGSLRRQAYATRSNRRRE